MARLLLLILLLNVRHVVSLSGQVYFKAPTLTQASGGEFSVDITTEGFQNIVAVQFAMQWDPAVIEFIEVESFNLPTNSPELHFGVDSVMAGLLTFAWFEASLQSVDMADGASVMSIRFKAVGNPSTVTPYNFVSTSTLTPKALVLSGTGTDTIPIEFVPGQISLTPSGVEEVLGKDALLSLAPNPVEDDLHVAIDLMQGIDIQWELSDIQGKKLAVESVSLHAGQNKITIPGNLFPERGMYLFSVRTSQGVLTQTFIAR